MSAVGPYARLDAWIGAGTGLGSPAPTFLIAPPEVCAWMIADANELDPSAPDVAMYRGLPVYPGPGYGVGSAG